YFVFWFESFCGRVLPHLTKRFSLRFTPAFSKCFCKVSKKHREPEPCRDSADKTSWCLSWADECLKIKYCCDGTTDFHGKHYRVINERPRIEFEKCIHDCTLVKTRDCRSITRLFS